MIAGETMHMIAGETMHMMRSLSIQAKASAALLWALQRFLLRRVLKEARKVC